jgi:hypothetical protein
MEWSNYATLESFKRSNLNPRNGFDAWFLCMIIIQFDFTNHMKENPLSIQFNPSLFHEAWLFAALTPASPAIENTV